MYLSSIIQFELCLLFLYVVQLCKVVTESEVVSTFKLIILSLFIMWSKINLTFFLTKKKINLAYFFTKLQAFSVNKHGEEGDLANLK
jgi:hypothetical protein